MNESTSNKDVKNPNASPGGGVSSEEVKKQEQQYPNPKNMHPQVSEKLKRNMMGYQNQNNESKEDEKVTDTEEKKENILHGPDASIFIKNQKYQIKKV